MSRGNPLSLSPRETALIRLAAALCTGDDETLASCVNRAVDAGATSVDLREVVHTSYLFDGYPTALEGFRVLAQIFGEVNLDMTEFTYCPDNIEAWRDRGSRFCRAIYGPQFEPLMKRVAAIAPELSDAMIVEGYGKTLSRTDIEPALRELCVVAMLIARNRPRQLLSHALGSLRLGVSREKLNGVLKALDGLVEESKLSAGRTVIEQAIDKHGTS